MNRSEGVRGVCQLVQDNRVSDHRTKINFDLMSVLNGELDGPVQVHWSLHSGPVTWYC